MQLHNREGTPVDPVPFLVMSLLGVLGSFSYGPPYLLEFGAGLAQALTLSAVVTVCLAAGAYHRYVWTARPELGALLTPGERLVRLFYGALIGLAVLALLSLPLLVR